MDNQKQSLFRRLIGRTIEQPVFLLAVLAAALVGLFLFLPIGEFLAGSIGIKAVTALFAIVIWMVTIQAYAAISILEIFPFYKRLNADPAALSRYVQSVVIGAAIIIALTLS